VIPFADPYAWLALRLVAEVADQALGQSLEAWYARYETR